MSDPIKRLGQPELSKGSSNWVYQAYWHHDKKRFRVTIHVDSYANQSSANIYSLDSKLMWHLLANLHYGLMASAGKSVHNASEVQEALDEDERALLDKVALLLATEIEWS